MPVKNLLSQSVSLVIFGTTVLLNTSSIVKAQYLPDYDPNLAPHIQRSNPMPGDRVTRKKPGWEKPTWWMTFPKNPRGIVRKILITPNIAGDPNETYPGDPADGDGDGNKDMSYPYYPDTWRDIDGDGVYDQSFEPSHRDK